MAHSCIGRVGNLLDLVEPGTADESVVFERPSERRLAILATLFGFGPMLRLGNMEDRVHAKSVITKLVDRKE